MRQHSANIYIPSGSEVIFKALWKFFFSCATHRFDARCLLKWCGRSNRVLHHVIR